MREKLIENNKKCFDREFLHMVLTAAWFLGFFLGNCERPTDRPTNQPKNQKKDIMVQEEVTLPVMVRVVLTRFH